ncbi:FecR domain-containing protein [Thiolapillus sp.]
MLGGKSIDLRASCLALAFSLFFAVPGSGLAEPPDEWLYRFQPGDNLWDLTERFLVDQRYWNRLVRLNKVQHPRHMPPGTEIRIPLSWLKVEAARVRVLDIRGEVFLATDGGKQRRLQPDTTLKHGDRLTTGADASVLLEFADGTRQLLGGNTEVEMVRINRFSDTGIGDTTIKVLRGETENIVPTRGTRFEIRTPSANTAVRGTRFRVKVPPLDQNRSHVEVVAGAVNVTAGKERVVIPAGFGTLVKKGERPSSAMKLLPAPRLKRPAATIRQLPMELSWDPLPSAVAYRIRIFRPDEKTVPLLDLRVEHNRFSNSSLPDGRYRLRLRALDANGLEGEETEVWLVLDARPLPPVAVAPAAQATVRGSGAGFEWSAPPRVDGYRFQLSVDPDFRNPVLDKDGLRKTRLHVDELQPGRWYWRVASLYQDEQGTWSGVQQFFLKPEPEAPRVKVLAVEDQLHLSWQAGLPEQRYQLQVAEDESFHSLVTDEILDEPRWSSSRPQVPVHFRVRMIDDDGYAGAWSPAQTVFPEPEPWYMFGIPALAIILLAL